MMNRKHVAGDIVVTKVSRHFHIGRAHAEVDSVVWIAERNRRADALTFTFTCQLVVGSQRVFLYGDAATFDHIEIDVAKHIQHVDNESPGS